MKDSPPTKYKLLIAYDGTCYSGWQVQPNAISIQALIQRALSTVLRTHTHIIGSGRTDKGVHALGQCAHFTAITKLDVRKLHYSLNSLLPKDIRIVSIIPVSTEFHARFSALRKTYEYHIHLGNTSDVFTRLYSYRYPYPINLMVLQKAISLFIGEKDFTSFSNEASKGSASKGAIRHLYRLEMSRRKDELILTFEANGFLYKMVRNIVGTLLEVASGKISLEDILKIFEAKDRKQAAATAPPHGLFLVKVSYPEF